MIRVFIILLFALALHADALRNGALRNGRIASPGPTADSILSNYVYQVNQAGDTLPTAHSNALYSFVANLIGDALWESIYEIGPFAGNSLTGALVKLKPAGPWTLANSGFTNAQYTTTNGIAGDGTNWLDTGANWATLARNDGTFGLSVFVQGGWTNSVNELPIGVGLDNVPYLFMGANTDATATTLYLGGESPHINLSAALCPPGLWHGARSATNALTQYVNGQPLGTNTEAVSTATRSRTIGILGVNYGGFSLNQTRQRIGFYAFDNGRLGAAGNSNFALRVNVLMAAMQRIRPLATPMHLAPVTGQSLAAGAAGFPPISTNASYGKAPFSGPLVNGLVSPNNQNVLSSLAERGYETISSGFAAQVGTLARAAVANDATYDPTALNWAEGGLAYSALKRGTAPYSGLTNGVGRVKEFAAPLFNTGARVAGVLVVHGETDGFSFTYSNDVREWQGNYQTDLQAVTGDTNAIPLFHSQPSAWTSAAAGGNPTNVSAFQLLNAYKSAPPTTILVCPKYVFPYGDGIHLTNTSYRWLGEYYGLAWDRVVRQGALWQPLYATNISRVGAVIDLVFTKTNLVLDTSAVSDPGNYGFEYFDNTATATISSVALVATAPTNTVRVTLSGTPTGSNKRIRYAFTGTPNNWGGPTTGPRGNLRDSSAAASLYGNTLFNWCVHFDEAL